MPSKLAEQFLYVRPNDLFEVLCCIRIRYLQDLLEVKIRILVGKIREYLGRRPPQAVANSGMGRTAARLDQFFHPLHYGRKEERI